MRRSLVLLAITASFITSGLHAQRVRFGFAFGKSLVGGGDSKVLVDAGNFMVTGAGDAGRDVRGSAEFPMTPASVRLGSELFYHWLRPSPNPCPSLPDPTAYAALNDRGFGMTGAFVAAVKPG